MSTVSTSTFLEALQRSRLLSEQHMDRVRDFAARRKTIDADELAESLVEQKGLTRWQAQRLLVGNSAFFLGQYKFIKPAGEGAHGVVFRAVHSVMQRTVAVKILSRARLTHRNARARFRREVQAMARLNHPNIVAAFDAGQVGETQFLVMEYIDGFDLRSWSEYHRQLDIDWACEFIRQGALGLHHAHEQGMVHRDVKPANILVTWDARSRRPVAKVLDLGLARILEQDEEETNDGRGEQFSESDSIDAELTQVGAVVGTPDYIAPEQILRDTPVDERTDVYGLGCTLFRMLTGRMPFEGKSVKEKILARLATDATPPPLRSLVSQADARLEAILSKMLSRQPHDRFTSAEEVAQHLAPYARSFQRPWSEVHPAHIDALPELISESRDFSSDERLKDFLNEMGLEAQWSLPPKEEQATGRADDSGNVDEQVVPAALADLPPLRPVSKTLSEPTSISGEILYPPQTSGITVPIWVAVLVAIALLSLIGVSLWAVLL